jgi:hypothetical protein
MSGPFRAALKTYRKFEQTSASAFGIGIGIRHSASAFGIGICRHRHRHRLLTRPGIGTRHSIPRSARSHPALVTSR